ncbi:MAG: FAD-binding oxidoreductase [Ruthenibacterium sp.]
MKFNKPTEEIIKQLGGAVNGRVYTGDAIKQDYAHDEMAIYGERMPDAVVEVISTQEVSSVCKICYENDIPVIPRGAGTGLCGGCVALYGGIVLDTSKMNKILSCDMENFTVRVQAGVLLDDLANDCASKGVMYPPDPGEKFATVGGNVASNAGGMRAVKYGTTRDYVRAMTVVLPDGEIVRFGGEVSKTSSGYSMMHLMIGSEGTLGIITELSLKLIPQPKQSVSLLAMFANLGICISCVSKIKMAGLEPQALEFMTRENVVSIEAFLGKTVYPGKVDGDDVGAYLLVTLDCGTEDEMNALMENAAEIFTENGALDVVVYDTPEGMRNAWAVRAACLESILANYKQMDECDVVVPIPQIANFVNYVTSLESEIGLAIRATGHAGDGNVHVNVCANGMDADDFMQRAERFMELAYGKASELGGLISGEHGIGSGKVKFLETALGKTNMRLMRGVKAVFDPKGLLNPGKVCNRI